MSDKKNSGVFRVIDTIKNVVHSKLFGRCIGIFLLLLIIAGNVDFNKIRDFLKKKKQVITIIPKNVGNETLILTQEEKAQKNQWQIERELEKSNVEQEKKTKLENLRKEFTNKPEKNGRKVKNGDIVNIKMVLIYRNDYNNNNDPMTLSFPVNKKDIIGKSLIGKTVGSVVTITAGNLINDSNVDLDKEIKKLQQQNQNTKLQLDLQSPQIQDALKKIDYRKMFNESQMSYRIKIISFPKEVDVKKILEQSKM